MRAKWSPFILLTAIGGILAAELLLPRLARAHCDTLDGPVVKDAQAALQKGDVTPALKWITPENEPEVRTAFAKVLAVRTKAPEARDLADMYFFETLVRLHRAGEGAPYTGLKPAGTDPGAAVTAADKALETGSPDELVKLVTDATARGLRERLAHAQAAKQHAGDSVDAGREFVRAYVEFVHYAERLHDDAQGAAAHHGEPTEAPAGHHAHEKPQE